MINRQTFNLIIQQVIKQANKKTDVFKGYRIKNSDNLKILLEDTQSVLLGNNKIMIFRDVYNIDELIEELDYFFAQIECLILLPSLRELYNIYVRGKYD